MAMFCTTVQLQGINQDLFNQITGNDASEFSDSTELSSQTSNKSFKYFYQNVQEKHIFEEKISELIQMDVRFAVQNQRSIESTGSFRFIQNLVKLVTTTPLVNKNILAPVSYASSLIRIVLQIKSTAMDSKFSLVNLQNQIISLL